jgi:hypothetical protein
MGAAEALARERAESEGGLTGWPARSSSTLRNLVIAVFLLNTVSAALFLHYVHHPVYDDPFNIYDVHAYEREGLSVSSIRANKNPPGPTSFVWMAATVRLIGGNELRDARIGALLSWIFLVCGALIAARYSQFPELWYSGLLASLIFPHSAESAALVLTEGPALLFAVLGAMAWIKFASQSQPTRKTLALGIAGGLSMGLAVTCRQYYLALLPAAFLLAAFESKGRNVKNDRRWYAVMFISLAAAALPVLLLTLIWKGLSSPGMANGGSYANWTARIGLDASRPLIAAFYTAVYFLPLTIPAVFFAKSKSRWRMFLVGLCGGVLAALLSNKLLQPGPLRTAVHFLARGMVGRYFAVGVIAAVAIYAAGMTCATLWQSRKIIIKQPLPMFAIFAVAFFIAEQIGVGGNIPFYDRYMLQMAPFLGILAFAAFPRVMGARLAVFAALAAIGQVMLWRFA